MDDNSTLTGKLDEVLNGLEEAVKKKNNSQVNSKVVEFSKVISEFPGVLGERDLTRYENQFQRIMKQGGYLQK